MCERCRILPAEGLEESPYLGELMGLTRAI